MDRMIIENRTSLSDEDALDLVKLVVKEGRISGTEGKEQYCYCTRIKYYNEFIFVSSFLNKKSDRFVVHYNDGSR